ncbi:MAG TPA: methyltransferase domain-containing protein [Flavisolibacter sp.]|nr:methyltransferase domain-containing protein [Flavisolibacter sp.]
MKQEFERISDIKRLDFIADVLHKTLPKDATVLDVGCGNGIISRSLGRKGFKVLGIDISEKTIEKAKALNDLPNVDFQVMSAEQLAVSNEKYHAVVCSEVLEHLNEPHKLLLVLHQSLKEDGVLIVTVPNGKGPRELFVTKPVQNLQQKNNWIWKSLQQFKKLLGYKGTTVQSSADDLTHIQFFTKKSLENLARQTKFNIVRFGKTNFIEDVFPFSIFTKRIKFLQKVDCAIADRLPYSLNGGFVTVWKKN